MHSLQKKIIPVVILIGPTAIGKTEIGIILAQLLETEIISADSMQIYRYLDIGTSKPTPEQRKQIQHHMLDIIYPDESYNAARYSQQAESIAVNLYQQKKIPLVVGGTGLYIRALIDGIFEQPKIDIAWQNRFKQENEMKTNLDLYNELQQVDVSAASKIHLNDRRRILRALEVFHYFGVPISRLQKEQQIQGTQFQPYFFGLKLAMKNLYRRIETRVDQMLNRGWVDEVKYLRAQGYSSRLLSLQGLGYRQINTYLDGKIDFEQMVYLIKRDTRRYAKRQMTWFRQNQRIVWFDLETMRIEQLVAQIDEYIKKLCKKT